MKKNFTLSLILLFSFASFAQQSGARKEETTLKKYHAYTPDGRISFASSKEKIIVKFKANISLQEIKDLISKQEVLNPFSRDMLLPSPKVAVLTLKNNLVSEEMLDDLLYTLNASQLVEYANPFLVHSDGTLQGITEHFYVKLKSAQDIYILKQEAKKEKCEIGEAYKYDPLLYCLTVDKQSNGNALVVANHLMETGKFKSAEVDFLLLLKRFSTNDTYLNYQWSLNNTGTAIQYNGTPGADMKVFNAWTLSTGNAATKVAVIDEGVDLVHPDLIGNILPGYDGTGLGSGGAPVADDAHGTACAGIIAATGNNNLGIAGVAYNAKIVPVRIAYSSGSSWVTSNAWIGASIDWAWDQGDADVLSNSWGGGSSSTLINDAVGRATTQGRGGLGAPVLFAAGNDNSAVSYPATLSNVISVTAMSMCNQRKSTTSCDGETFWGSNYGTNTDISAPGVKIYTCDISGANGYSTGDYTATFNGTSSATPNAAGVMALILAVNPSLTMAQARQILESTCDKVGGYTYNSGVANQPNGTWSNDLGYGRVNALAALQLANPVPCVNPPAVATTNASPTTFCSPTNISFSLSGISFGIGQTYQWQSSPDNITYTAISGATNSNYSATISASTWYRCVVTCGTSTNSTPVQVSYTNPTITTFPYTQNFDASGSLPCGWTNSDINADGYTWSIKTTNSRSTPNCLSYSYNPSLGANDWAFSAPLQLTAGTNYRVRFWYRVYSASYPEKLEVKFGSAATAAAMTSSTIYSNTNLTNTVYAEAITSTIAPTSSGIYFVGFRAFSNANMWDIHLDDMTFEIVAACATPLAGGTASGPSSTAAGTSNSFTVTGNTGTNIQWEQSIDAGVTYTAIPGATSSTSSFTLPAGTILVRARSSSPTTSCPEVFSNVLSVNVAGLIGDVLSNPIMASLPYSQSLSNTTASGYTSAYTGTNQQASPDIFVQFTTGPCADSVKISTCGTTFDSYIHLLSSTGTHVVSNDDNGVYCTGTAASLKVDIAPNTTYIAVFEGYSTSTGTINAFIEEIGNVVQTLTATASGPTTFCQGGSVTLTVTPSTGIVWNTGATTPSITVSTSGNYVATVPGGAGCLPSSNVISVVVNPLPVVTASNVSGCSSSPITLIGSPAGGTFSIPNPYTGPSTTYTYSYTNANGCSATSAPATVTVTSGMCYCIPTLAGTLGCTDGDVIARVILNTLDNNTGAGCPGGVGAYSDYSSNPLMTTNLQAGSTYTCTVYAGQYSQSYAVWIDFNDNGVFETTDRVGYTTTAVTGSGSVGVIGSSGNFLIAIPCGANPGNHRMRVRCNYNTAGTAIVPCASTAFYGETEDYTITIDPCNSILNLTLFLQSYYSGSSTMTTAMLNQGYIGTPLPTTTDVDDITVELHASTPPFNAIATAVTRLKTNGTAVCTFPAISGNYYIAIKHRNTLVSWSANPVTIGTTPTNYDFSSTATQTYGANAVQVDPNVWALYAGEIVQDENLDLLDVSAVENDINLFLSGYFATDINGDGNIDLLDSPVLEYNVNAFIFAVHP